MVEVRYPEALVFLREHGPEAVAVLHVVIVNAAEVDGRLVVGALVPLSILPSSTSPTGC